MKFFVREGANYCGIGENYLLIADSYEDAENYADDQANEESQDWDGDDRFDDPVEIYANTEEVTDEKFEQLVMDGYEIVDISSK